jgi:hypothetical protein
MGKVGAMDRWFLKWMQKQPLEVLGREIFNLLFDGAMIDDSCTIIGRTH